MVEQIKFPGSENKAEKENLNDLISEKFNACRGVVSEQLGVTNVHKIAEYFYYSLYQPDKFGELDVKPDPKFPQKLDNLQNPRILDESRNKNIPDKEEFIQEIRKAMTRKTDFESCLYEGALEQISNLTKMGPVIIWTKGDNIGIPEVAPGSHEQVKKASAAGIGRLRSQLSRETGRPRKEIISFAGSEDKLANLPEILKSFEEKEINEIVILEDTLKNLVAAAEIAKEAGFKVTPVWVRQGREKDKTPREPNKNLDDWANDFNAIKNIDELKTKLESLGFSESNEGKAGYIVDYDGVLSNDKKKQEIQAKMVVDALREKGWI